MQVLTGTGSLTRLRRPRRRSDSTGEISIDDEDDEFADDIEVEIPEGGSKKHDTLYDGYVVDHRGKIRGEARNYEPYSRFGEIMLYDIDIFGFVSGYVSGKWQVMSEQDLLADRNLARRLYETKYQVWMRKNSLHLSVEYMQKYRRYDKREFEKLCRDLFRRI